MTELEARAIARRCRDVWVRWYLSLGRNAPVTRIVKVNGKVEEVPVLPNARLLRDAVQFDGLAESLRPPKPKDVQAA